MGLGTHSLYLPPRPDPDLHAEQPAPRPCPEPCPEAGSAAGEVRSGSLEQMLEAAWAGEKAIQTKVSDLKEPKPLLRCYFLPSRVAAERGKRIRKQADLLVG